MPTIRIEINTDAVPGGFAGLDFECNMNGTYPGIFWPCHIDKKGTYTGPDFIAVTTYE